MSSSITHGVACLWGVKPIPDNIVGIPDGSKVRFRVRNDDVMRCFVKAGDSVSHYILVADTQQGPWRLLPQGANVNIRMGLKFGTPQYNDHLKLIADYALSSL